VSEDQPSVTLGVVVAPGLARDVTEGIAADLVDDLRSRFGDVAWQAEVTVDRLVVPPAPMAELFDAARRKLLAGNWDLAVAITDLPLRVGRRPVACHVSPTHGIAVVSLPALGPMNLRARLRRTLLQLVGELVGAGSGGGGALRELAADTADRPGWLFAPAVLAGNVRLLAGMVRANRPWRLAVRLYTALVAAFAAGAYGVVNSDIWRISAAAGWPRLTVVSAGSIVATTIAILWAHGLWERAPDPRVREQVVLFNIATTATVLVGVLFLYAALLVLILAGSGLVIAPGVMERALVSDVSAKDYAALAWFVASLATVGGGLGASLQSYEAVREAAYAVSPSDEPVE
jgi:hypothetical protein